jgi:3'(2'), 5'-bisphosphate nucleotidase
MEIYATDFGVAYKQPADPVTIGDEKSNALIVAGLRAAFPDDGIVAEESPDLSDATRKARCWYVDPLDGTKEFIAKNGEFSVMIGLAVDGESRLGVVLAPATGKLYRGVVGAVASVEHDGRASALRVSDVSDPRALALVVSRSHRSKDTDAFVAALGIAREQPSGSVGLKCGLIAERAADVYLHPSDRSSKWDACAPEAILRAAGGRFTDVFGAPFRYDVAEMPNRGGILACNAAAFDAVLPAARDAGRSAGLRAP